MSTLADMVVQSRSRLTHTASRLEKRGWVQREACVGDRRGVELVLTDDGVEAITAMARVHVASVREHLLSHLSAAQFAALGKAMTAIGDGIEASGTCEEARAAEPA
jgi:DNA-binding MarR family transcriptional regulator